MGSACRWKLSTRFVQPFGMRSTLFFILVFSCTISLAQLVQETNDFIFVDKNVQEVEIDHKSHKPTSSQKNFNQHAIPVVDNFNDEDADKEAFFPNGISNHLQRFKRGFFDFWKPFVDINPSAENPTTSKGDTEPSKLSSSTSDLSSPETSELIDTKSTTDYMSSGDKVKRTAQMPENDNRGDNESTDSDDEDSSEEESETNSSKSDVPSYSGGGSTSGTETEISSKKMYFRIVIKLLVPYSNETASHNSPKFMELSEKITSAINQIFSATSMVESSRLAAIINSADPGVSKAIIDLQMYGKDGREGVESKIATYIATNGALDSVPATSTNLMVRDFEGIIPTFCDIADIPCLESQACYPADRRCDNKYDCPEQTDENDCPTQKDPNVIGGETNNNSNAEGGKICRGDNTYVCRENLAKKSVTICYEEKCDGVKQCPLGDDEADCISNCTESEISCDGKCLPASKFCDGIQDCSSNSDESDCPLTPGKPTPGLYIPVNSRKGQMSNISCTENHFLCDDKCIPKTKVCDGVQDCQDSRDEISCPCNKGTHFMCADSRICLPLAMRCDNTVNCNDQSDEQNCTRKGECKLNQRKCYDGSCISVNQRCDGVVDCPSGEDEAGCPNRGAPNTNYQSTYTSTETSYRSRTCRPGEFQCSDGKCILANFRCDGQPDCSDNSDEELCSSTPRPCTDPTEYLCSSGLCINRTQVCDRKIDCPDYSDEASCKTCRDYEFQCDSNRCIAKERRCDGFMDCLDRTDEEGCSPVPSKCVTGQFECNDGTCILSSGYCNGRRDCPDNSDEDTCPRPFPYTTTTTTRLPPTAYPPSYPFCKVGQFACRRHFQCIPDSLRCNGRQECLDNTDEENCSSEEPPRLNLKAIPGEQIIKESQEVVFQCRDEGPLRASIRWERGNGLPLPPGSRSLDYGRLEIPNIQLNHAGVYVCRVNGEFSNMPGSQIQVYLQVEPFTTPHTIPPQRCRPDQATCQNGECISKSLICNGQNDCSDGSDESRCNIHGCEPNEFRCRNLQCVPKHWRCDSEADCQDGSDEENCQSVSPGSNCRYDEFACTNSTQCVPKSLQCDGENDCNDGTDEHGCSKVTIIQPPPPSANLRRGDTFSINCRTFGVPTPEVVWRMNWGHVPSKCTSTSANGVGTLTCPNIQPEDQGAYSCEGMNNRGSTFAPIDTILIVSDTPEIIESCPRGKFSVASRPEECIDCFCFGVTKTCSRAHLFVYPLPLSGRNFRVINVHFDRRRKHGMEVKGNEISDPSLSVDVLYGDKFRVRGAVNNSMSLENIFPYLALPDTYLGNQLKSYGSKITFKIAYENDGVPVHAPYIIIVGNGKKFVYGDVSTFVPGAEKLVDVQLAYGSWYEENEDINASPTRGIKATREGILMALANLEYFLIKTQYTTNNQIDVTLSEFKFYSAGPTDYGLGQADLIEKCECPQGYTGLSCESCEPGYERIQAGPWLGQCRRSQVRCELGTYGDPTRGISCRPCPCPLANARQFGASCFLDTDGRPTCNCPPGYEGRNCERCSVGFNGNPLTPGSACERTPCDPAGSMSPYVDPVSGTCRCKQNVVGQYCKQCKSGTFFIHSANQYGCINCFCMGVSKECMSSAMFRQQIVASFGRDTQEFKIAQRKDVTATPISDILVNPSERDIIYRPSASDNTGVLYWILPERFLNDKITSYGGVLNYTLRFTPSPGGQISRNSAPDVEIYNAKHRIRLLYYKRGDNLESGTYQTISVPLLEQYWQREDGQVVNREHFLMALSQLTLVIIKATYTTITQEVALQSVVMDTAEERNTGYPRAYEVEECRCPPGYRGLSCQECSTGYYRVPDGFYLGLCEPCECNGYSNECDAESGYCLNCDGHTTGPKCDQCELGYIGNPAARQPCVLSNSTCVCDPRGSIDSSCQDGQCTCKANVIGARCDQCRQGTFDLRETWDTGCLDCYCSGKSRQCQSSNLSVTQIPAIILDQNHGFTLTDSNRNRFISTGFRLKPAENQIEFDYTTVRGQRLYWSLPSQFIGNKVTSYGGTLSWTQGFSAPPEHMVINDQDLIIIGDGISLFWSNNVPLPPNTVKTVSVKLEEKGFRRITESGTQTASRSDLLRVLSNIETILIRAVYATQTTYISLSDVVLDVAVPQLLSGPRSTQVESCVCPTGYKGYSCETCDRRYYHAISSDGVTKECKPCPCNGNEESCFADATSRVSCKCQPGYAGEYCEGNHVFYLNVELKPLNIYEPVGSSVNITCLYRSSEKLSIKLSKHFKYQMVPFVEPEEVCMNSINGLTNNWIGEQFCSFVVDENLRAVVCEVVNDENMVFGSLQAVIKPEVLPPYQGSRPPYAAPSQVKPNSAPSPTIIITMREPLIQIVALGGTVHYTCQATSLKNKPVTVSWSKEGDSLPAGRAIDDGTGYLVLMNVIATDAGTYVCTAYDGFSYARQEVNITVGEPTRPRITITPSLPDEVLVIGAGEVLNIKCEAFGSPTPNVELRRLTTNVRKSGPGQVSYIVTSVSKSDEDTYYCRATNNHGTDTRRIIIRVRDSPSTPGSGGVNVSIQPPEFNGFPGEPVRFQCYANPSYGYRAEWSRPQNQPLPESAVDQRGTLIINNVSPADAGVYVCNIVSETTGAVISKSEAMVTVANDNSGSGKPPVLHADPENQKVPQGSTAVIRCISSDPKALITWRKMNEDITNESDIQIRGSELRIPSTQPKHRGIYICSATNAYGNSQAFPRMEVERRELPLIQIYPKERTPVVEGGDTLIQCKVNRGVPSPRLRWYRPGNMTMSPHVQEISGVLRFTHVTAEDEGEYICTAENVAGHADAVAFLEIISPPTISLNYVGSVIVTVGQPVQLECMAQGKPMPQVYWRSTTLPASSFNFSPEPKEHSAIFELTRAQVSDSGVYTCVASNTAGQNEEQIQVTVVPYPPQSPITALPTQFVPSMTPDEEIAFPQGSVASLRCDVGSQKEQVYMYWKREDDVSLPELHEEYNGKLTIYNVKRSDAGKYMCIGFGNGRQVLFKKTVTLRIIVPPQITLNPIRQIVRPGDNAYVACSATGDQPITIYWSAVNGNHLPKSVSVDRGLLQFRGITVYDAGKYVCRAQNLAGEADAVAEVIVNEVTRPSKPVITAQEHNQYAFEESNMDLKCTVKPTTTEYEIKWSRDKSELPRSSQIVGDTLRLFNLKADDTDRYTCEISSPYGISSDYIDLFVDRRCSADEFRCNDGSCILHSQYCDSKQDCPDNSDEVNCHNHRRGAGNVIDYHVHVGHNFQLSCSNSRASAEQDTKGVWSKVDGYFENNVQVDGNLLSITDVQIGNAGDYRCTLPTTDRETYKDYRLHVNLASPGISTLARLSTKTVPYGKSVDLVCTVDVEPPVNYSWVIHSHDKSLRKIVPDRKNLTINNAGVNVSGLYFCNAAGKDYSFSVPVMLLVQDVIPAFSQNSYVALPPLTQATMTFNIEITFKPTQKDGLLLYTGQQKNGEGDFVSFGLQDGYPEFKFDLGWKPVTIRSSTPLHLDQWHTVRLIRNGKTGYMEVNGFNFTSYAEGKHETLDLQLPLFVGGLPSFEAVEGTTGFNIGFTGCISKVVIDSKAYDLKNGMSSYGLGSCNNCETNLCQNGGGCQETSSSSTGYTCICTPGFSGKHCDFAKDTCYLDTCGDGKCLENDNGTECQCPFGKTGKNCKQDVFIKVPSFAKNSYLAYSTPMMKKKFVHQLKGNIFGTRIWVRRSIFNANSIPLHLQLKVKPMGETVPDNGIILYVAENEDGSGDYVAISIIDSFIELKGKIMSKPLYIKSNSYLESGQYATIDLKIDASHAEFSVANEATIAEEFNPTNEILELKLGTPLYIGGYDKRSITLPEDMTVRNGLTGCVSSIKLSGTDISQLQTYSDSANVNDCMVQFGDICEKSNPCQNNGICRVVSKSYICECSPNFSGQNCERTKNICELLNPCQNGGRCVATGNSTFVCSCPLGYIGSTCTNITSVEDTVSFSGNGYVELSASMLPHQQDEYFQIVFVTKNSNGLLFWQAGDENQPRRDDNFISVAVQNGYVQLSYRNKLTFKELKASSHKVDDGLPHTVTVRLSLSQKTVSVELDSNSTDLKEYHVGLQTRGNIYIGGLPDIKHMTNNLHRDNFNGCVQLLKMNNLQAIDFGQRAISAGNAAPCPVAHRSEDMNEV